MVKRLLFRTTCFVAALILFAPATTADAFDGNPPPSRPTPPPVGTTTPPTSSGSTTGVTYNDCHLAAGPGGFGETCFGGSSKHLSIKAILAGDPLPTCWDEALTPDELAEVPNKDTEHFDYYLQKCLRGIDPRTLKITGDGVHIDPQLITLPKGTKPVTLTVHQQQLVNLYAEGAGDYPIVTLVSSPTPSRVRVNQDVSYYALLTNDRTLSVQGVSMRARMTRLEVQPLGAGGPTVSCLGQGVAVGAGDTQQTVPKACWYAFTRSSAQQPNETYPMLVTATWEVRYTANAGLPWNRWTFLNGDIHTTSTTQQRVTEIQTVVVK